LPLFSKCPEKFIVMNRITHKKKVDKHLMEITEKNSKIPEKFTDEELIVRLLDARDGKLPRSERPIDLDGVDFSGLDLNGVDFSGASIKGANFQNANLSHARFFNANLSHADFSGANLRRADFTGADLSHASLDNARARHAGFGMCRLDNASMFQAMLSMCTFSKASFQGADVQCADLSMARLREADLSHADFTESSFKAADLSMSNVAHSIFNNTDLRQARLRLVRGYRQAKWIGADIRDINFAGAYIMRRFVMDQNYLKEFRQSGRFAPFLYMLWKISSNCGRSMALWSLWICVLALVFAVIYYFIGFEPGPYPTPVSSLYFSVVTMMTLGYGDAVPNTTAGQVVAMIEVVIGYVMLGGLLSILSNKIARRSE
jgi:uncharacterized protein YjbI with pentapeptide repeats